MSASAPAPIALNPARARRIALAAQGFHDPRPNGRVDVRHFRRVLQRVGVIQLDSVNVAARAHYLPPFSRLGPYSRKAFDDFLNRSGEVTECWAHAAALVPVERRPLFRHRMAATEPWGAIKRLEREHPGYLDEVLQEVAEFGPLTVSGLQDAGERTGPWWGYGRGKIALEWHFHTGRLVAWRNGNFNRVYDLAERRIPAEILTTPTPERDHARRELLSLAAASLGVATARDLADYYRMKVRSVQPLLADMVRDGLLLPARVAGWKDGAYLFPDAVAPRRVSARALISPFDSLIWFRERTERLFGMRYQIEIYVPESKREYGYYVYPFLLGEDLVARVDLKADRKEGRLLVRGAFLEPDRAAANVAPELAAALHEMASWLGLGRVTVGRRGDLAGLLRAAV